MIGGRTRSRAEWTASQTRTPSRPLARSANSKAFQVASPSCDLAAVSSSSVLKQLSAVSRGVKCKMVVQRRLSSAFLLPGRRLELAVWPSRGGCPDIKFGSIVSSHMSQVRRASLHRCDPRLRPFLPPFPPPVASHYSHQPDRIDSTNRMSELLGPRNRCRGDTWQGFPGRGTSRGVRQGLSLAQRLVGRCWSGLRWNRMHSHARVRAELE